MRELLVTLAKAIDDGNNNLSPWRTSITNALNRRELRGDKEKCNQIEEQLDKLRDLKDRFNRFEDLMSKCLEDPHNYLEDLKTMAQDTMTWLTTKVAHAVSVVKVANEVAMKYHFVFPKRTAGCKTLLEDAALKLLSQPANATIDYKALDDQLAEHHNHVERVRKSAPTASTSQNRVPRHVTSEDLPKGFVSSATSSLVGPASAGQSQKVSDTPTPPMRHFS